MSRCGRCSVREGEPHRDWCPKKADEIIQARYLASAPNGEGHLARAAARHACCWEPASDDHHPLCENYEPPTAPEVSDAQESLL